MDKNKIIEAAGKLVAKGAYDKAIKEYQKVLDADPKDVRILQKMGELYQKKNDNASAAGFIMRVAESYAKDGFFLKAVAQYKQVLKLDPTLIDVNLQLAELHQQLQLMGEAMAYFQIVANHHEKQGDTRKSLDVLRKMVELDPDNVPSRVKLADLCVREQMNDEAVQELQRAAEHLKRQNRIDDYLRVAERVSALQPDNLGLAKELAELYLQRSDQKRALAKLQVCFKADSRDIETLRLLGVAFQGLGQTSKTLSVYKELARAYADKGLEHEAEQVWRQVAQLDPNDPDVQARAPQPAAPAPAGAAPQPSARARPQTAAQPVYQSLPATGQRTALQPAVAPNTPAPTAKPKGDSLAKLLTETDVYVKYGLHDKALEHLRRIFATEPENIDAHEKAYAIYVASNNHAQAAEQLLNVLRLHTRGGDRQRAQPYIATILQQNPGHPEVPVFLQALRLEGGGAAVEALQSADVPDDAILVDSSDDEVIVADDSVEEPISAELSIATEAPLSSTDDPISAEAEAAELVSDELALAPDDAEAAGAVEVEPPPVLDDYLEPAVSHSQEYEAPTSMMLTGDEDEPSTGEFEAAALVQAAASLEAGADDQDEEGPTMGTGIPIRREPGEQVAATRVAPAYVPAAALGDEHEAPTRTMQALDPAKLRSAGGSRSEVVEAFRRGPLEVEDVPSPPPSQPAHPADFNEGPAYVEEQRSPAVDEVVEAPPEDEPAGEECDEANFFIEQALFDEAREILETVLIAYPDHRRAAQLLAQVERGQAAAAVAEPSTGPQPANGEARSAFDLAAELADELGELGSEEAQKASSAGGDEYQVSVEEVFAEFKKGLEKVVKPEDVETHYDLGIAYKEMGLADDAISEFTIARKGCIGKKKEVDCLTMVGLLQLLKGDYPMAIDAFQQALASEHSVGDVEKATRYELGAAYEGAGHVGRALAQFQRVQVIDPTFRDVAAHVSRLAAIAVPEEDPPPSSGPAPRKGGPGGSGGGAPSRKVGYV